jgi:uncharacterized protein (DUF305 family)
MAEINVGEVALKMLEAARGELKEKWPEARNFAESEAMSFVQRMAEIKIWKERGEITEEQAQALSRLHQRSMKMVFTALEGISLAMAEKAINAALDVVRGTINTAIGWAIL